MIEKIGLLGVWDIKSENILTGEIMNYKFHNMIIQGFYDLVHGFFNFDQVSTPTATDLNLNYMAMGDDITPVLRADDKLHNEVSRYGYVSKTPSDSKYAFKVFLGSADGNMTGGYIKELGVVANGSATLNSGTLISRSIVNIKKNENIKLTLTWTFKGVAA